MLLQIRGFLNMGHRWHSCSYLLSKLHGDAQGQEDEQNFKKLILIHIFKENGPKA